MKVIVTGGTGLAGSRLARSLAADGHDVVVLSRSPEKKGSMFSEPNIRVVGWDAKTAAGWGAEADGADAIVNLAGESIGGDGSFPPPRWTEDRKRRIMQSRLDAGRAVVEAIEQAENKPRVLVQASASGYYGPRGDELVTEETGPGPAGDFQATVTKAWEGATDRVEELGVRRAIIRSGVMLDDQSGALPSMIFGVKMLGGALGSGEQYFPWVHVDDVARAIRFLIESDTASGPYNLTAPHPIRQKDAAAVIGRVIGRPAVVPVPAFALKAALGEISTLVLDGQRLIPAKLQDAGFEFTYADFETALRDVLGKPARSGAGIG